MSAGVRHDAGEGGTVAGLIGAGVRGSALAALVVAEAARRGAGRPLEP